MKPLVIATLLLTLATAAAAEEVITRGAAVDPDAKAISVAALLENPDAYTSAPVVVEANVVSSCTRKGCWMELAAEKGQPGVRVTFKDYGFFVPLDAKGMQARAEGVAAVKTLSKAEADHLEEEGATIRRNSDGSATEVSFVATGVELRK